MRLQNRRKEEKPCCNSIILTLMCWIWSDPWPSTGRRWSWEVVEEKEAGDGSFKLVYLGDGGTGFRLELTWLRDRTEPYDLGEQEFHLPSSPTALMRCWRGTGPWAAYALKTRIWAFTSLRIRTATGSSSSRSGGKG